MVSNCIYVFSLFYQLARCLARIKNRLCCVVGESKLKTGPRLCSFPVRQLKPDIIFYAMDFTTMPRTLRAFSGQLHGTTSLAMGHCTRIPNGYQTVDLPLPGRPLHGGPGLSPRLSVAVSILSFTFCVWSCILHLICTRMASRPMSAIRATQQPKPHPTSNLNSSWTP